MLEYLVSNFTFFMFYDTSSTTSRPIPSWVLGAPRQNTTSPLPAASNIHLHSLYFLSPNFFVKLSWLNMTKIFGQIILTYLTATNSKGSRVSGLPKEHCPQVEADSWSSLHLQWCKITIFSKIVFETFSRVVRTSWRRSWRTIWSIFLLPGWVLYWQVMTMIMISQASFDQLYLQK